MDWEEHGDNPFEDDDEEVDTDHQESAGGKQLIVYLVDCCPDMFLEPEDSAHATYFDMALQAIVADLKYRVLASDKDQAGVCFFNTREKKNIQEWDGVYVLHEVGPLSVQLIQNVRAASREFEHKIGSWNASFGSSAAKNPLQHGLWTAQSLLQSLSMKKAVKRVLLFTNDDDPFGGVGSAAVASDKTKMTVQRANDMQGLGISIELFPMNRPGEEFNVGLFYRDMVKVDDEDEKSGYMVVATQRFEDLLYQVKKKTYSKRVLRQLKFNICHGVEIAVSMYAMLREAKPPKHELVRARDNLPVKTETANICNDTGAIMPSASKKFYKYGDEKVVFTQKELTEVKSLMSGRPVMKLLGFKPLACLKDYHNLRPSVFIYPDESAVSGSTRVFIALHKPMLRLGRFAVCVTPSHLYEPLLVALVAQEEVVDEAGQLTPPGMQMIYLPYCDDIRYPEKISADGDKPSARAADDQISRAMTMIQKLNLTDFSMQGIHNPGLQRHYAVLEACALQEDTVSDFKDDTLPNEKGFAKPSAVAAITAFKDEVYGPNHDAEEAEAAAKAGAGAQKRKAAAEAAATQAASYDWGQLAKAGKFKSLTVVELKFYLAAHGLSQVGKKDVLIQRILDHLKV
ncbi:hypothetical protein CBR_g19434 [Chara braunii]|uniref:SAP domain-containing protein n=1 Tax=Chara braunii TaxID=69332 RepID=A0A388KXX1_CHABU|nr:hypothetical protein CBR_g19434 [Chara braunii]|eukprot:GBG74920.1 hypothetical protein CBR_g19434 [Chara braunii]